MTSRHIAAGIVVLLGVVTFFTAKYLRAPKRRRFAPWGWTGLAIILLAEILLRLGVTWAKVYFTPLAWTGYLLLVDAAVRSLEGRSRLGDESRRFFALALCSVPLWLIFEAYNLRLANWKYIGLPDHAFWRGCGYVWSFATIWPAIFETADFIRALGVLRKQGPVHAPLTAAERWSLFLAGLLFVTVPLLLPWRATRYLFGAVWVGFILLLEPLNYRWQGRSFLRDWENGQNQLLVSFLLSGLVCGVLWEFWNYWAAAKWIYIFPMGQGSKIFEMPLAGYLGFPPFALECFVMYEFLRTVRKQTLGWQRPTLAEARGA